MVTISQFMVTLQPECEVPVTFWVSSATEVGAEKRAKELLGEPSTVVEIRPTGGPALTRLPKDS